MIVDPERQAMLTKQLDNPPSYDAAVSESSDGLRAKPGDSKAPALEQSQSSVPEPRLDGPSTYDVAHPPAVSPPTAYHYQNPLTGERVQSLLPPDHPEMVCLQSGMHVTEESFGVLGILAAIIWFPIGIGCCLLDRSVRCVRCGRIIKDGLCA